MPIRRLIVASLAAFALAAACENNSKPPTPDGVTPIARSTSTSAPASAVRCSPPYPDGPPTAETVFCADPTTLQRAAVIRIVDGDTLHVEIDGRDETVRFYGIDTAERGEPCFAEATERLRGLAGTAVLLRSDARDQDRYERLLRYVYASDGTSIDATLIAEGLALAWTDDGALRQPMIALEATARAKGTGCLWSAP